MEQEIKDMRNIRRKKTYLFVLLVLIIFTTSLLSVLKVKANEKNVITLLLSESGEVSPPIFDINDEDMYPGAVLNKNFVLKNATNKEYTIENVGLKDFNIKDINGKVLDVNDEGDLKLIEEFYESIECRVSCEAIFNNVILHADDIKELIKGKSLDQDITISKENEKKFNVVVSMKTSAGNNMQGLQANFSIVFNAVSISDATTVEIPTPTEPSVIPPTEAPGVPPIDPPVEIPIIVPGEPGEPIEPIEPTGPAEEIPVIPNNTDTVNLGTGINPSEDPNNKTKELVVKDAKLVQTGSPIDTVTLLIIGMIFIGTGAVITRKKKEQ